MVGWIHLVGISPESPSVVVQRALDHPDKISIVASNVPQLIEQFAQQLTSAESNLFVWLRRLEHPGAQIRNALRTRPPYCYTWHILKHLFPDVGGNDKTLASLLVHLFIDQEREFTLDTMCDEDRSAHHRCWEKVRKRKIKSLRAARMSVLTIRAMHFRIERGLSLEQTAACCGNVNSKTIARNIAAVLGVDSHAALALTMDEVVVRAYRYMLINPDSHPALPPLPGRTDPRGSTSAQRERERESLSRQAARLSW